LSADATSPELRVALGSLVVLVGASGSGKSTFARMHFRATEIVSSDACRALVSDDARDQAASEAAFDLLRFIADKRIGAGRLTVVDATNVREEDRSPLVTLARRHGGRALAIVLDLPLETCLQRNSGRTDGCVPPRTVREQVADLREGLSRLHKAGFHDVLHLSSQEEVDAAQVRLV
jgi:protein phosphatase